MFCARVATRAHFRPITHLHHSAVLHKFPSRSSIRMSSSNTPPNQIIEHIVLFKVKPDADPSAVTAMLTNLNSLISLDPLHISAGPLSRCVSKSLTFTHMLHSRYRSKSDLTAYADHPTHISVVTNFVKPVVDDVMAVDWVAEDFPGPALIPPGSATRFTVLKLKEEGGREEVLKVLKGVKDKFPSIEQLTIGENFSTGRAKGYSIASVAVCKEMKELQGLDSENELTNQEKDKVREFLDGVLVLDFVVAAAAPAVQSANL